MSSAIIRRLCVICHRGTETSASSSTQVDKDTIAVDSNSMLTDQQVNSYLADNPHFLEEYIMNKIDMEQLERWIIRKSKKVKKLQGSSVRTRKTSLSKWKFCVHADKRQMLQRLSQSLQDNPTQDHVLWELATCISSAVKADGFRLFLVDQENCNQLHVLLGIDQSNSAAMKTQLMKNGITIPLFVAKNGLPVRVSRGLIDTRFPENVLNELHKEVVHVFCQPITETINGKVVAVLELWRTDSNGQFYEEDEEIAYSYLIWGGIALHYAHLYLSMNQQKSLNDFLLVVVKSIFQDMVSINSLVIKIMNFAQRLVDADRASLFLVDSKNKELYATIFDVGVGDDAAVEIRSLSSNEEDPKANDSKEIRFPLGTGIAGQVAMTGEVLNIRDAYADSRFNRAVDQLTGYKTKTILCMPIFIRGSVIGVVQMVNKHKGYFSKNDEEAFETFAIYCGLALHHAKLYDKIRRSEQKYKVALDVLSYHNTCSEDEFKSALSTGIPKECVGLDNYYFNPFELDDVEKVKHAMFMFNDLFGTNGFDQACLLRFILTVKKNYRRVPYHNWTHGFSVANSTYCIIKNSGEAFNKNESLALYVGALCHDLDHRGKNNKFMLDTESPLAAIYSTSTMEHHHFNQAVTILQQEGHNIFGKLTYNDYKEVLGYLKHCILATDLALFFPNKAKLFDLVQSGTFSWKNFTHRSLIQAIAMTASDLSANAKPWDIQVKTVEVIFEEFYDQGDAERAAGRIPIPMMDRQQPDQQASSQVGFLTGICIPCYNLLNTLIPETKALLEMCKQNLDKWTKLDEERKHKK